jgi:hypothetical protein
VYLHDFFEIVGSPVANNVSLEIVVLPEAVQTAKPLAHVRRTVDFNLPISTQRRSNPQYDNTSCSLPDKMGIDLDRHHVRDGHRSM